MKRSSFTVIIYALLVLIGGLIGFIKAQSSASLLMSLFFATGLSLSAGMMLKGKKAGLILAIALIMCLGVFFSYRFLLTSAFMPAGLMCILSLATLGVLFIPPSKALKKHTNR